METLELSKFIKNLEFTSKAKHYIIHVYYIYKYKYIFIFTIFMIYAGTIITLL